MLQPDYLVVVALMQANVFLTFLICSCLLRKSRLTRANEEWTARKSSFGAQPRADGKDFFHWKTYNDYERCVIWVGLATLMLIFAFADVNGAVKVYPWWLRQANHGLVRWFFDLSLFQMCSAYRTTLTGKRDKGVLVAGTLSFVFQAVTAIMEQAAVPRRGRLGCWNNHWNFARNFGSALIETGFIIASVRFALKVRTQLKKIVAHSARLRNQRIIRGIVMRILMIGGICFCALIFGVYVGFRNAGIYTCSQPACTLVEFLHTALWGIAYVAVSWYTTIFLYVGSPFTRRNPKRNYFSTPSAIVRENPLIRAASGPTRIKRDDSFYLPTPKTGGPPQDTDFEAPTSTPLSAVEFFKQAFPTEEPDSSTNDGEDTKESVP